MLRFEKFLCCLKLETGGLVLGYLTLILNCLSLGTLVLAILGLSVYSCQDMAEIAKENHMDEEHLRVFNEYCATGKTFLVVCFIFAALFAIGFAIIGWLCVSGTMKRDHNKVKPMVILLAVAVFLGVTFFVIAFILGYHWLDAAIGLFNGLIYGYFFVCIYSLFYNFRDEFERGFNTQYRVAAVKA